MSKVSDLIDEILLKSYVTHESHRIREDGLLHVPQLGEQGVLDIFNFNDTPPRGNSSNEKTEPTVQKIIWATDNYSKINSDHSFAHPVNNTKIIVPRINKTKEEQKKRTKEKAEVFTPTWVCNLQNNLIDQSFVEKPGFNIENENKTWTANPNKIVFKPEHDWASYTVARQLEACCGEAPYVVSPYDAVTGEVIPVLNEDSAFMRIGILDRKLRVVYENAENFKEWFYGAKAALANTYGYEWQGDNLWLARKNIFDTIREYSKVLYGRNLTANQQKQIAEIISWNFWQMDGLKMVIPGSCSLECVACKKKTFIGHDGISPLIRFMTKIDEYKTLPFHQVVSQNQK